MPHPITSFQNKGVKFNWTSKCEANFQKLKEMLTSAPVLKIAYLEGKFVYARMHENKELVEY